MSNESELKETCGELFEMLKFASQYLRGDERREVEGLLERIGAEQDSLGGWSKNDSHV